MKFLSIAAIVVMALALALSPTVSTIYGEAYPSDGMKRAVLDACAAADPRFNRLNAGERAQCYARARPAPPADSTRTPPRERLRAEHIQPHSPSFPAAA